ncbi:hypothetical protein BJV77DRAFT_959638 [Russula vinacea]|nr:hypothetical protein BJV77DRAFT_959638 [Russula vinacea]
MMLAMLATIYALNRAVSDTNKFLHDLLSGGWPVAVMWDGIDIYLQLSYHRLTIALSHSVPFKWNSCITVTVTAAQTEAKLSARHQDYEATTENQPKPGNLELMSGSLKTYLKGENHQELNKGKKPLREVEGGARDSELGRKEIEEEG